MKYSALALLLSGCTLPPQPQAHHYIDPDDYAMVSAGHWLILNCPRASNTDGMQSDVLSCRPSRYRDRHICVSDTVAGFRRVSIYCDTSELTRSPTSVRCYSIVSLAHCR